MGTMEGKIMMKKSFLIGMSVVLLIWIAGCGVVNDAIDEVQKTDSIQIMRTVGEDSAFVMKKSVRDEEVIANVREVFAEASWEEMPDDSRSHPTYRIETYDVWVPDDATYAEIQDIESEEYAKLTHEQSEVIIQLVINAFH